MCVATDEKAPARKTVKYNNSQFIYFYLLYQGKGEKREEVLQF